MPSDKGNPSIQVIYRGVSPKISFLLWSIQYMTACFHEDLPIAIALGKLVT